MRLRLHCRLGRPQLFELRQPGPPPPRQIGESRALILMAWYLSISLWSFSLFPCLLSFHAFWNHAGTIWDPSLAWETAREALPLWQIVPFGHEAPWIKWSKQHSPWPEKRWIAHRQRIRHSLDCIAYICYAGCAAAYIPAQLSCHNCLIFYVSPSFLSSHRWTDVAPPIDIGPSTLSHETSPDSSLGPTLPWGSLCLSGRHCLGGRHYCLGAKHYCLGGRHNTA